MDPNDDVCAMCSEGGRRLDLPMPGPDHHPECGLRAVLGGIGHLTDHPYWCGEMHDPDMGLTYRASALLVWEWVRAHGIEAAT